MAKVSITVRLEQELIDEVDAFASMTGMTRTDVVEKSLVAGLKEGKAFAKKLEHPVMRGVLEAVLALNPSVSVEDKEQLRRIKDNIKKSAGEEKRRKGGDSGKVAPA
ncbi:MAG: hypothetical protein AAGI68_13965 [Planctomycetota bacterium]